MLYFRLFTTYTVPGITAVLLAIVIMNGIQNIMLGICGEYIGRIYEQVKDRPLYVVGYSRNLGQVAHLPHLPKEENVSASFQKIPG